jgi:hypothetical protein
MMNEVTEFAPASEHITATIHMTAIKGCEAYQGPLHIGHYNGTDEIFIESEGIRTNIPAHLIELFIKQIRRAAKLAKQEK